jgi:hypothetical protein
VGQMQMAWGILRLGSTRLSIPRTKQGGLAGAVVRLSDEVLVGRREYHGEGDGLDLTRAAESHLIVQPLEELRRELQILERRRRLVHRAARRHLEHNQININQPISYGDRLGLAAGMGTEAYGLDLGVVGVNEERRALRAAVFFGSGERESFDLLGLRLHGGLGFRRGPCRRLSLRGLGLLLLLDVRP